MGAHGDDWFVHSDFTAFGSLKISRVQTSLRGSHQLTTLCLLSLLHLVLSVQKLLSSVDWNLIQADSMVAGPDRETGGESFSLMITLLVIDNDRCVFLPSGEVWRNRKRFIEIFSTHQPVRVLCALNLQHKHPSITESHHGLASG